MSDRRLLIFSACNENTDPLDRDSGLNRKRAHTDATVDSTSQLSNESPMLIVENRLQSTSDEPLRQRPRLQNVLRDNYHESERLRQRNRRNTLSAAQKTAIRNADQNRHFQRRSSLTPEQTIAMRTNDRLRNS